MPNKEEIEKRRADGLREIQRLLSEGYVEEVLLLPEDFGGTNDPRNITWLPREYVRQKEEFDAAVRREIERGITMAYSAVPSYASTSFVPTRLNLSANGHGVHLSKIIEVSIRTKR